MPHRSECSRILKHTKTTRTCPPSRRGVSAGLLLGVVAIVQRISTSAAWLTPAPSNPSHSSPLHPALGKTDVHRTVKSFSVNSWDWRESTSSALQRRWQKQLAASGRSSRLAAVSGDGEEASDEAEWKAVLAALKLYKAAFGDMKVPMRFVVPPMKPWPTPAHGLKLGKAVANMRATGKYLSDNSPRSQERKKILNDLGFVWRIREPSTPQAPPFSPSVPAAGVRWEQVLTGFKAYRQLETSQSKGAGAVFPPANFVIPDAEPWPESVRGLPLGRQLEVVTKSILPKNEEARERFARAGWAPDAKEKSSEPAPTAKQAANDLRFQKVYSALKTYKELNGDLLVPQPFAVPETEAWPKETWGLRLGARVNAIRSQGTFVNSNPERKQMLDDLGFVWAPPKAGGRLKRRERLETQDSGLPDDSSTADDTNDSSSEDDMESLFEGSFDFGKDFDLSSDSGATTSPAWNLEGARLPETAAKALEDAAAAEEELYAPPKTLADSMEYAYAMAKEVGIIESITERQRVVKGKREKNIPWFNDDFGDGFVFEDVVEALTLYKSMYGDFSNLTEGEGDFIVPAPRQVTGFLDDDDDDLDSFDIDASARAAAAIANFEEQGDLESSGDLIAAEIKRLQDDVGQSNVATETDRQVQTRTSTEEWPEHLTNMPLGNVVNRIRDGSLEVKHLPERKEQLDALDFDWGDPVRFIDIPFEKATCAMYAYYLIRGDLFVLEDFVMPDEDPWPQALAGYEIGQAVKRIRQLQNFFEAYHPEKVTLLRMIDFMWFGDTMALPLDPNEQEMDSENLLLSAMGHPDYAKMIDIPMGLPDKIISDGPFFDSEDPKLWWRKWHNWDYVKDYWYQQGRRDNAFVLRGMGYPRMAEEHEAKYGPGLFQQINETLADIEAYGLNRAPEESAELLQTLNYYRQEMLGCTDIHPSDRDSLIADFDKHMLEIVKNTNIEIEPTDELDEDESAGVDEPEYEDEQEEEGYEDEDLDYEDVEFDVEDELGLDLQ